jgi:hypothetical protein
MPRRWLHRRDTAGLGVVAAIVIALAMAAWSAPVRNLSPSASESELAPAVNVPSIGASVTLAGVTLYTEQMYSSFSSASFEGKAIDVSAFTPAPTVASKVLTLFQQVSSQPLFSQLSAETGPGGFGYGFAGNVTTGLTNVYFGFNVIGSSGTSTTSWEGSIPTMTVSGPTTVEHPTVSMNTVFQSGNWAGSSWWQSGSPTLTDTGFNEKYPSTSKSSTAPQNLPKGVSISQDVSVWVGLTNSNTYLLQTGALTNVSAGATGGQIFFELACGSGKSCPSGAYYYPFSNVYPANLQVVPVGHYVENAVWEGSASTDWDVEEYDYTAGQYNSWNWNIATWLPGGFSPQWTQYIVETPEIGGLIQQLPDFSQVIVGDDYYGTCGSCGGGWHSYSHAFNQYQLEQASSNYNTNQGYVNVNCGFHGTYGCPTITYQNSNYNYQYMLSTYGIG